MSDAKRAVAAVGIGVSNLERSEDFYFRVLGMRRLMAHKLEDMEEVAMGYGDSAAVVLMHYTDGSEPNYKDNPVKLALSVPDPKEIIASIRGEGLEIVLEPQMLNGLLVGMGKDPDGYIIEVFARPA